MVAAAVVGSAVVGGVAANSAAKKSANAQKDAGAAASAAEREMFDITREDQAPYRALATDVGLPGIRSILSKNPTLTGAQVMAEPGYQFGLGQGNRNIEGSASARGGLYSGATLKALNRFGNDYASTKFGDSWNRLQADTTNRFNRYATAAGIGQAATNQVNAQGAQLGQSTASNLIGAGNASAASTLASGNTWGNALNRVTSYGANNGWFGGSGGGAAVGSAGNAGYGDYTDPSWFGSAGSAI